MLVFGLVHDSGWEPPDYGPEPPEDPSRNRRESTGTVPWRSLAWLTLWFALMAIVPLVISTFGGLAWFDC